MATLNGTRTTGRRLGRRVDLHFPTLCQRAEGSQEGWVICFAGRDPASLGVMSETSERGLLGISVWVSMGQENISRKSRSC